MTVLAGSIAAVRPRTQRPLLFACLIAAAIALVGVGVWAAPTLALGGVAASGFLVLTLRNVIFGVGCFTVLMFFDRATALQAGGLTPVKAAGAVLALLWVVVALDRRRRAPLLTLERPLLGAAAIALVAWAVLSALWAEDAGRAVSTAFRLAQGVVLLFIVYTFLTRRAHVRVLVTAFIVGGIVAASVGVLGSYDPTSSVNDGRLSGGFDDPNELAAVLLPAMVFCAGLFLTARRAWLRILLVVGALGMARSFLQTDSQAGLVALAVVLLAAVAFSGRARRTVSVGVALLLLAAGAYYTFVTEPVALQTILSDNNTSNRKTLWRVAGQMVVDHPVQGVGAGNFVVREAAYGLEDMNLKRADLIVEGEIVHNTYLEVAAELGAPGLALFLGLIAASLSGSIRAVRIFARAGEQQLEVLARSIFVGTLGLLTAYVFATNTYEKQLWLLLAVGVALPTVAKRTVVSPAAEPAPIPVVSRRLRVVPPTGRAPHSARG